MKTAFVHIGTHKTGSTYLQSWLIENQEKLLIEQNLLLPSLGPIGEYYTMLGKQHGELATAMRNLASADRQGRPFALLRSEIAKSDHDILISSELFENRVRSAEAIDFLVRFFGDCGYRVHLVVYLREQADYLNSRYAQDVRRFFYGGDFTSYAERAANVIWFNYRELFQNMLTRRDLDFSARPFPVACRNGLETDLMQVLTGNPGLTREEISGAGYRATGIKNPACGPMTVLLARLVQEELARQHPGIQRRDMMDFTPWMVVAKLGDASGWNDTKFIGMNPELAARTRERFREQNESFAQMVWACSWRQLFAEPTFVSNELKFEDLATREQQKLLAAIDHVVDSKPRIDGGQDKEKAPCKRTSSLIKRFVRYITGSSCRVPVAQPEISSKPITKCHRNSGT